MTAAGPAQEPQARERHDRRLLPRRILATGLSGFAGRHLEPALAELLPDAKLLPLGCDITDAAAVEARVASLRPDACIHLAAIAAIGVASNDPR